jgi:hypothetical protein
MVWKEAIEPDYNPGIYGKFPLVLGLPDFGNFQARAVL